MSDERNPFAEDAKSGEAEAENRKQEVAAKEAELRDVARQLQSIFDEHRLVHRTKISRLLIQFAEALSTSFVQPSFDAPTKQKGLWMATSELILEPTDKPIIRITYQTDFSDPSGLGTYLVARTDDRHLPKFFQWIKSDFTPVSHRHVSNFDVPEESSHKEILETLALEELGSQLKPVATKVARFINS